MSTDKRPIHPANGPKPAGPYTPVIVSGGFAFVSGRAGLDPSTGKLADGDIQEQTRQTLRNIGMLLEAAGCSFADVVKTQAYITQPEYFQPYNEVYREFFPELYPARTT